MAYETCKLTLDELKKAAEDGIRTHIDNLKNRGAMNYGNDHEKRDFMWNHEVGSITEHGTAKHTGLPYCRELGDHLSKDVGGVIQVRGITNLKHCLLVQPTDPRGDPYVLVYFDNLLTLHFVGWNYGEAIMRPEFFNTKKTRRPCYFVPQEMLLPFRKEEFMENVYYPALTGWRA